MQLLSISTAAGILYVLIQTSNTQSSALPSRQSFTETIPIAITTPLPANVSSTSVLSILHSPVQMITLNPLIETYSVVPGVTPITYSITDKLLLIFSTTYSASFTNRVDGMDTVSSAAGGVTLDGHWTVADGVLTEEVDVTGNILVLPFVEGEIQSSHEQLHAALMAEAAGGGS
ncbi:hypothetical protein MMC18_007212 [Xylographa bjoerkii]|nr:hypothetical protein [Xylographa bjoerkii]